MHLKISATLGSPANECANFGVCTIDLLQEEEWDAFTPRHIRHVKAWLSQPANNELTFIFPLSGMLTATRATFFGKNVFQVDTELHLPDLICNTLGIYPEICRLMPGKYPIQVQAQNLIVAMHVVGMYYMEHAERKVG